jgi:small subunit ribosomal protein S17
MSTATDKPAAAPAAPASTDRGLRKRVIGVVISDKMQKTRTVSVTEQYRHEKYGKFVKRTIKFHVHDEKNDSKAGDKVLIVESRPLSATKRWRLMKVLERSV